MQLRPRLASCSPISKSISKGQEFLILNCLTFQYDNDYNHLMKKILYVDDNQSNLDDFCEHFQNVFEIVTTTNPLEMFKHLESQRFDAILLDIHMPDRNGFELLNDISNSAFANIPVLFYTTDELQLMRYEALKSKAMDIIYRTQTSKEVELRILNKINLVDQINSNENFIKIPPLVLNLETQEAFCSEKNLGLTPIEFKILVSLAKNYPEMITREQMIRKAWNLDAVQDRTVNTHVTNLRNKLPKNEFSIESMRGTGLALKKTTKNSLFSIFKK